MMKKICTRQSSNPWELYHTFTQITQGKVAEKKPRKKPYWAWMSNFGHCLQQRLRPISQPQGRTCATVNVRTFACIYISAPDILIIYALEPLRFLGARTRGVCGYPRVITKALSRERGKKRSRGLILSCSVFPTSKGVCKSLLGIFTLLSLFNWGSIAG